MDETVLLDIVLGNRYELFGLIFICGEERIVLKDKKWKVEKIEEESIDIEQMFIDAIQKKFY